MSRPGEEWNWLMALGELREKLLGCSWQRVEHGKERRVEAAADPPQEVVEALIAFSPQRLEFSPWRYWAESAPSRGPVIYRRPSSSYAAARCGFQWTTAAREGWLVSGMGNQHPRDESRPWLLLHTCDKHPPHQGRSHSCGVCGASSGKRVPRPPKRYIDPLPP